MTKPSKNAGARRLQVALSFGFSLSGAIVMGYVIGGWLDGRLGAAPWFTMAGIVLGVTAAFSAFLRQWRHLEQQGDRKGE